MKLINRILDSVSFGFAVRRVARRIAAGGAPPIIYERSRGPDGRLIRVHSSQCASGGVVMVVYYLDGMPGDLIRWIVWAMSRLVYARGRGWIKCNNRWEKADVGYFRGLAGPPPSIKMVEHSARSMEVRNLAVKFESADPEGDKRNAAYLEEHLEAVLGRALEGARA